MNMKANEEPKTFAAGRALGVINLLKQRATIKAQLAADEVYTHVFGLTTQVGYPQYPSSGCVENLTGMLDSEQYHIALFEKIVKAGVLNDDAKIRDIIHMDMRDEVKSYCTNYVEYIEANPLDETMITKTLESAKDHPCDEIEITLNDLLQVYSTDKFLKQHLIPVEHVKKYFIEEMHLDTVTKDVAAYLESTKWGETEDGTHRVRTLFMVQQLLLFIVKMYKPFM